MRMYIEQLGMLTSVGYDWRQTISSLRCGISRPQALAMTGSDGEPVTACRVPLNDDSGNGADRLAALASAAIQECAAGAEVSACPLVLCGPTRSELAYDPQDLLKTIGRACGAVDLQRSTVVEGAGHAGIGVALEAASFLLQQHPAVIVGAVDTLLDIDRLTRARQARRIVASNALDGTCPGEAAAFLRVSSRPRGGSATLITGVAVDREPAEHKRDNVVTGHAQARAARLALSAAGRSPGDVCLVGADLTGERYRFYEAALATTRLRLVAMDVVAFGASLGEVGCAMGPVTVAYLSAALERGWVRRDGCALYMGADDERLKTAVLIERA